MWVEFVGEVGIVEELAPATGNDTNTGSMGGVKRKADDEDGEGRVFVCQRCKASFFTDEGVERDCRYHPGESLLSFHFVFVFDSCVYTGIGGDFLTKHQDGEKSIGTLRVIMGTGTFGTTLTMVLAIRNISLLMRNIRRVLFGLAVRRGVTTKGVS